MGVKQGDGGDRLTGFLHPQIPPLLLAECWTWDPQEGPSAPRLSTHKMWGFFPKKEVEGNHLLSSAQVP